MRKDILLLDSFNQESCDLYNTLKMAGYDIRTVVMNDDGDLPEDVISISRYYCEESADRNNLRNHQDRLSPKNTGKIYNVYRKDHDKPRYFNQITVPDYWEIEANNYSGKIMDRGEERGMISFFDKADQPRLVKRIDWKNEKGIIRASDHYDMKGRCYAQTAYTKEGKSFTKSIFDEAGREVLVENFMTQDILVNYRGKTLLFKNKSELAVKILEEIGIENSRIIFNSLSTPFFVVRALGRRPEKNILFWQEGPRDDIPGNMKVLLNDEDHSEKCVYVQNLLSYRNFVKAGIDTGRVSPLGFIYPFKKETEKLEDILICTNSDQIDHLLDLVQALPDIHFHIVAVTEMSSVLLSFGLFQNVTLYPGVHRDILEDLFMRCSCCLDICQSSEIVDSVRTAFLHNQLLLGFRERLHNPRFIAKEHVFDGNDWQKMTDLIIEISKEPALFREHLDLQKKNALSETVESFRNAIEADVEIL